MTKLLIIIVVYNKKILDIHFIKNIIAETIEVLDIYIYDNSNIKQKIPSLKNIHFNYFHDEENAGVSKAYNSGIIKAQALKKEYILLLDQDSDFKLEYLREYLYLEKKYTNNYIYSPVVCNNDIIYSPANEQYFIGKVHKKGAFNYSEKYNLTGKSLINSGLMIPLKIIDAIGGFNENIKLDFSDFYFIAKYKKLQNECVLVNTYIEHHLSGNDNKNCDKEMHRFKYYCNGAKELSYSLKRSTIITVTRRMLRLIQKYFSLMPIVIFINYYIGNKKV